MSVLAATIVTEAARRFGDPNFGRVTRVDYLDFFNSVCRGIASRMRVVPYEATFTVQSGQAKYALPDRLVVLVKLGYSSDPTVADSYRKLGELFNDDFEAAIDVSYPVGDPRQYHPRAGFFFLVPKPSTTVAAGGLLEGYAIPEDVVDMDSEYLPLPDFLRDHVRDGMVIEAKRKDKQYDEATADEAIWLDREAKLAENIEDRSHDRRSALRPADWNRRYSGQA